MTQSELFRQNADNCLQLEEAAAMAARKQFKSMADAWLCLADSHDWLDGVVSPVVDQPSAW